MFNKNREQRGTGIEKVPEIAKWNGQFSGGPVQPRKVVHLERWTSFFETFPVGLNQSIQFWTEIFPEILAEWIAPTVTYFCPC